MNIQGRNKSDNQADRRNKSVGNDLENPKTERSPRVSCSKSNFKYELIKEWSITAPQIGMLQMGTTKDVIHAIMRNTS